MLTKDRVMQIVKMGRLILEITCLIFLVTQRIALAADPIGIGGV